MRATVMGLLVMALSTLASDRLFAEETDAVQAAFVGPPPKEFLVSERGTLQWTDIRGDRRFRHGGGISGLAISADGSRVVSYGTGFAGHVKLWEASTGREVMLLQLFDREKEQRGLARLVAARRGNRAVFTTPGGLVGILDLGSGEIVRTLRRPPEQWSEVALDDSGRWMAAPFKEEGKPVVTVHDLEKGTLCHVLRGVEDWVGSVAMSPDGRRVYAWTGSGLRVWDAHSGKHLRTYKPPEMERKTKLSPDGRWLIVLGEVLQLIDTETGEVRLSLKAPVFNKPGDRSSGKPDEFEGTLLDPRGRWVATTHKHTSALRIWDLKTTQLRDTVPLPPYLSALAVSADGSWIAAGHRDGSIRRIDALKGTRIEYSAPDAGLAVLAADRTGARTVSVEGRDVVIRDEASGTVVHRLRHRDPVDDRGIQAVAMSPDGKRIVSAGTTITIWDGTTGKKLASLAGRENKGPLERGFFGDVDLVVTVAVDPEHGWVAAVTYLGAVTLYDAQTGKPRHVWPWGGATTRLAVSPDGSWLLASVQDEDQGIRFLDPATGAVLRKIATTGFRWIPQVDVSPDGRWFAATGEDGVSIYNASSGKRVRTLEKSKGLWDTLAVASDGPYVFAGGDGALHVWNSKTGAWLDRVAVDAPIRGILVRGDRVWLSLGNGATQIYRHKR